MNLAPIILFAYKRIDTLQQTVEALQQNYLAKDSELIIYSDGPKKFEDEKKIEEVREYISQIEGFKSVKINLAINNKGLASSIISGVTEVLKEWEQVIVLEDDLITSPNFLNYMNEGLQAYRNDSKIFSITGFSIPVSDNDSSSDVYFTRRADSWSWASWKDRWMQIDWQVNDYKEFKNNSKQRYQFNRMGSDMSGMLDKQMEHKIDSWAIRWCYHQFKYDLFSVHPYISKVQNIGFSSDDASHTKERFNRFKTKLDSLNKTQFNFSKIMVLKPSIIKQYTWPFSFKARLYTKIASIFIFK